MCEKSQNFWSFPSMTCLPSRLLQELWFYGVRVCDPVALVGGTGGQRAYSQWPRIVEFVFKIPDLTPIFIWKEDKCWEILYLSCDKYISLQFCCGLSVVSGEATKVPCGSSMVFRSATGKAQRPIRRTVSPNGWEMLKRNIRWINIW